jgi:hypothetical protein
MGDYASSIPLLDVFPCQERSLVLSRNLTAKIKENGYDKNACLIFETSPI